LWLDAADAATITQSGGLVSQWNDKSGNNRHLGETDNNLKPTYRANVLNGKGGIDFNSNKGLFSTSTPTVAYAATIVKAANSTFGNYHAMLESRTNATRIGGLRASGSTIFWYDVYPTAAWEDGTSMTPSVAFNTINSPHIIEFTTSSGRGNPMSGVTVGNYDQVNQGGSGIQYEIIALSSVPSVADREKIEGYLAHKWGLAANLPSGHTYKSSPPSITAGAASSTPTLNINTALTNITHTTSGATGISNSGVPGANGLPAGVSAAWAVNLITISGTPTASGTFNYSIPLTGSCGSNATGTITVLAANAVGAASSTPTLCINTTLTNITHSTTGATGIANSGVSGGNGLPAGVSATWAGNVITISGTPTASGTFAYSILLTGGFGGSVSATGTITVTAANATGTASSTPTLCINTALTNITRTTTGATGIGSATGLPAGVSAAWAGNVITISGTPTASGTFSYSIPLTGGCGAVNATGTITVSPVTVGGSVSGTATVCPGSNSGTLTLSGHTGSVVRWESSSASNFASPTTISSTATSYTYTNLSSVTYYRAVVQSGTCSSSTSSTATITLSEPIDGGRIEW
ncbi:MAG: putative adhesin, partial [Bacteroidota bacterium]